MARGHTNILLRANVLVAIVEILLLLLAIQLKSIELVAAAVLIAYLSAGVCLSTLLAFDVFYNSCGAHRALVANYPSDDCWVCEHFTSTSHIWNYIHYIAIRVLFTASVVA